jgi:hypothetical protein
LTISDNSLVLHTPTLEAALDLHLGGFFIKTNATVDLLVQFLLFQYESNDLDIVEENVVQPVQVSSFLNTVY